MAINDVVEGRRGGYTWTRGWKFDVNDQKSMDRTYEKLGYRTMYVVAMTNRTLAEFTLNLMARISPRIAENEGIGLWRDEKGDVYVDDIYLFFGPKVSINWALAYARSKGQRSILKIDGRTRSYEFLDATIPPGDPDPLRLWG